MTVAIRKTIFPNRYTLDRAMQPRSVRLLSPEDISSCFIHGVWMIEVGYDIGCMASKSVLDDSTGHHISVQRNA